MKTLKFLSLALVTAILSVSCAKEGTARFEGNYTFKTGGTINVVSVAGSGNGLGGLLPGAGDEAGSGAGDETIMEETVSLTPESGQMDILTVDKKSGEMIVTMNIIGGTVITFNAKADGKLLNLEPVSRRLQIPVANVDTDILRPSADIVVEGYGERFDDVIIFRLTYTGSYTHLNTEYTIASSSIDCVAKKN